MSGLDFLVSGFAAVVVATVSVVATISVVATVSVVAAVSVVATMSTFERALEWVLGRNVIENERRKT